MKEENLPSLVHELYPEDSRNELEKLAKEKKKIKLIAGLTSLATSIGGGILEADFISTLYSTAAGEYQFALSVALPLVAYGASKLACYLYKKFTRSKASLRGKDIIPILPGVVTSFDTAAALRGLSKGYEIGYLGKVNKEVIFKSPVSDVMLSEARIGDFGLRISIAHLLGFGSIAAYLIDLVKPIKPISKIKRLGRKISEFASKSRLRKYSIHFSLGSLLALSSGIPYLVATPAICDATIELSEYAIEKIKARAERFMMFRKIQMS